MDEPDGFDLARAWFCAFNRDDIAALAALYHEDCHTEQNGDVRHGRDDQRKWLEHHFETSEGAFEGGARRRVRTIARIENGVIHSEWQGRERSLERGDVAETAGYDEFWFEGGLIRRQRAVWRTMTPVEEAPPERQRRSRKYPTHPIVGVGAVIEQDGRVVLIRRRFEPLAGQWSLPGGTLEVGETLEAGVAREILEETGLVVDVGPVIEVFDRIQMDEERRVRYHFVLIDYLCRPVAGRLAHGSDVDDAIFVRPDQLAEYRLTAKALGVIRRALEMARGHTWPQLTDHKPR